MLITSFRIKFTVKIKEWIYICCEEQIVYGLKPTYPKFLDFVILNCSSVWKLNSTVERLCRYLSSVHTVASSLTTTFLSIFSLLSAFLSCHVTFLSLFCTIALSYNMSHLTVYSPLLPYYLHFLEQFSFLTLFPSFRILHKRHLTPYISLSTQDKSLISHISFVPLTTFLNVSHVLDLPQPCVPLTRHDAWCASRQTFRVCVGLNDRSSVSVWGRVVVSAWGRSSVHDKGGGIVLTLAIHDRQTRAASPPQP